MAANKPMAVAISASAMPGATICSVACCTPPSATNELRMPHTVPNRPTYGLVEPMVARLARLSSRRSSSLSWPTRMARRAPSSNCSGGMPPCFRRANSRKPNSKMLDMPVAPPRLSICRYSAVRSPPFQKLLSKFSASSCARDSKARLRKMMAHENSEASSSRPMTPCTMGLACSTSRTIESSLSIFYLRADQIDEFRQRPGTERFCVDAGDSDLTFGEQHLAAPDLLLEADRRLAFRHGHAGDAQLVVEPRRLAVVHFHLGHGEHVAVRARELAL